MFQNTRKTQHAWIGKLQRMMISVMTIQQPNQNQQHEQEQQQQQPNPPPNPESQSQSHTLESSPSSSTTSSSTTTTTTTTTSSSSNITANTQQPYRTFLFVLLVSLLLTSCWGCWIMVVSTSSLSSSLSSSISSPQQQQQQHHQHAIMNDKGSVVVVVRKKEPSIELQQQQQRQPNARASLLSSIRSAISSSGPSNVSVRTTTTTTTTDDTKNSAIVVYNNNNTKQQQQRHQSLYQLREQVQTIAKSLVTLEEVSERILLKVFRVLTHPVVLLDLAIIVFAHAIGSGSIVVLLPTSKSYYHHSNKVIRWIIGSTPRRWFRVTGSIRRWTRLVSFVVERRIGSAASLSRTIQQLVRAVRNPMKAIVKIVGALWEHRSRYSLLSDYCWYVKPPQPEPLPSIPTSNDDE
ncbi:hypothetical protein IV203_011336 [Nitzschia inconspicua]|uniref:Uncharacterized protein n=1 Tax=Nitzschia inconspicua TaxID=303405 RepID=A0A9K3KRL9_9STRA|nr:hypothetical protein IV203_011336 [Nitzschia inconspicua]